MSCTRQQFVDSARLWLGRNEQDGSHREIIDIYNSHGPLARGYAVKYDDAWCATFVSAVAIVADATDLVPTECGCGEMVKLLQSMGRWVEDDNYNPEPGDLIFYDWDGPEDGECSGWPNHVGIVYRLLNGGNFDVLEGNYSHSVQIRTVKVGDRRIRGYGVPNFDPDRLERPMCHVRLPLLRKGDKSGAVAALQSLLVNAGYEMRTGATVYGVDGSFGGATRRAVRSLQRDYQLEDHGEVDGDTWALLLGGDTDGR